MILQEAFTVEPWSLRETHLDLDLLAQTESVFALANGHLGWRGNLDEGEPHGLPGSYLNGFYEVRPLPYAEAAYGLPESGQEVINVTNGKIIRLFVDDEPFDVRYGELRSHERVLDFRAGVLNRTAEWESPAGKAVRVSSIRLVSFTQRAIGAICYEVEPLGRPGQGRRAVRAARQRADADVRRRPPGGRRAGEPARRRVPHHDGTPPWCWHSTRAQRAAHRRGHGSPDRRARPGSQAESRAFADGGLVTAATVLKPGEKLRVIKFVAYGWSRRAVAARPSGTRCARRSARPGPPAGTGCSPSSARTSTTSGAAPTSRSTGTPRCSRRCASRCSTCCRPGPGRRTGPIPAKGLTGTGLRRARVLGHRDVRAAGAHPDRARRRRERAALAAQHAADGHRAGRPARA